MKKERQGGFLKTKRRENLKFIKVYGVSIPTFKVLWCLFVLFCLFSSRQAACVEPVSQNACVHGSTCNLWVENCFSVGRKEQSTTQAASNWSMSSSDFTLSFYFLFETWSYFSHIFMTDFTFCFPIFSFSFPGNSAE